MVEVFKGTPIRRMTTGGNYVNLTADVVLLSDYEALRAELEQVKRERDAQLIETQRAWNERDGEKRKRINDERLAGARVKMPSGELCRYIEQCREISNGGEYPWWSRLAEILSALAEPAGEAEPSKWSIPGSTYAGATTPPASAIREAAETARACLAGLVSAGHNFPSPDPDQIEKAFWALDSALAGSAE